MWATPAEITKLKTRYISNTSRTITDEGLKSSSAKLHPKGTILLTSRASIGYPAINIVPMATNQGFQSLIPNEKLDVEYGYQLLLNNRGGLERLSAGSTFLEISSKEINKYKLPIPPLPEQKKIASILTSVDEVIETTQKQIDKLQDLKKATMNELLTKGIGHTEFKDSELGRIPKSWECLSVGEMLEKEFLLVVKDGNHGSQYPRTSEFQNHGIPFLAASSIDENGFFNSDSLPHLSLERAAKLRIPNAKNGDVILTHNATVGRVSIIPDSIKEVITSTSTTYYRVNSNKFFNKYLRDFFEGLPFQNQLGRIMGQTTRNQVPITAQKNLFILHPDSICEQEEISSILNSLRGQLSNIQHKLATLKSLKKSLMQELLTGKVRVQVN
jgi:type I restriction enzyme, S subunit